MKRRLKNTLILSIMIPLGLLGWGLYEDRHLPSKYEWIHTVVPTLLLIFAGVWALYFFLTWVSGKRLAGGITMNRKQKTFRRIIIVLLVIAAIFGLVLWWFYSFLGRTWGEAIH